MSTERLVWVPFDPVELGGVPPGLRVQQYDIATGLFPSPAHVRFLVLGFGVGVVEEQIIAAMPSLEVVQTQTAGVDHIRSLVPPGVTLCNARGVHDASTAELAVALVLASLRGLPDFVRAQDRAAWSYGHRTSLADKRVLIVGHGSVGKAIERRLLAFEAEVLLVARRARDGVAPVSDLPRLLPTVDVVILVVPDTNSTRGMFDAALLARLKDGALLVNMARGPVVETAALLAELESGRLRAALDVVDPEPLPPGHPLWRAPGLLITPHVGGSTDAMVPRIRRLVAAQLVQYDRGGDLANVVADDY